MSFQFALGWDNGKVKMGLGRMRLRVSEEGREWKLPYLFYDNDLALFGELGENCIVNKVF